MPSPAAMSSARAHQLHLAPFIPSVIHLSASTPGGGFTHSAGKRTMSTISGSFFCLL